MPKRSKDRSEDLTGTLRDADYDWIMSLGEGSGSVSSQARSASSASSSSAAGSDGGSRLARPARAALPAGSGTNSPGGFGRRARAALPAGSATDGPGEQRRGGRAARERDSGYGRDEGNGSDHAYRSDGGYGPEPTKPGRAVRLTAGRAQDLEANPAAALFNPAAEEYGQPLYATPDGSDNGHGRSGPAVHHTTDTGEYRRPLYPAQDSGQGYRTGPQPAWHDDPLADTSSRGRGRGEGPRRQATGRRALPAASPRALPPAGPRALPAGRADTDGWSGTGWAETDHGPSQGWAETALRPDPSGGLGAAHWPEATGWPETEAAEETAASLATRKDKNSGRRHGTGSRKAAGRKPASGGKNAGIRQKAAMANAAQPAMENVPQPAPTDAFQRPDRAQGSGTRTSSTGTLVRAAPAATPAGSPPATAPPGKSPKPRRPAKKGRRRGRRRAAFAAVVVIAVAAVAGYLMLWPRTSHVVSTPPKLGSYVRQNASPMAEQFKHRLLASAGSDVKNVVAATYQGTGSGTASVPPVVVFIGGNLAGNASASSLISAYISQMQGAVATSPGKLGGRAACAPGASGGPAECAWADGDTFGVVVSATLGPSALANEMRQMRPLVERVSKRQI